MRRAFLSVVLLVSAFLVVPALPATAAPYCGLVWGSLDEDGGGRVAGAGRRTSAPVSTRCYDRLVVDVAGDVGGYTCPTASTW